MEKAIEQYTKRPLYVFDLPEEFLSSLQVKQQHIDHETIESSQVREATIPPNTSSEDHESIQTKGSASCTLCNATFPSFTAQRDHTRTDWHGYNLKQRMNGLKTVSEIEFDKLLHELDVSISGSEEEYSDEDTEKAKDGNLSALLRKQAKLRDSTDPNDENRDSNTRRNITKGSPMVWFSSSLLPEDMSFAVYKALFQDKDLMSAELVHTLRTKQLQPYRPVKVAVSHSTIPPKAPSIFLCMIGGGHFAGMIISLTPKLVKGATGQEERQAIVIAHKTFHRYTTRRKQGGSQSANDASKGNAHSAGAGIRRHNEAALEAEVRALLFDWKTMIEECDLLFVRATGVTNRRTLFSAGPDQVLKSNDPRIRGFPFNTRRATQGELMRAFVELTRGKITKVVETQPTEEKKRDVPKKVQDARVNAPSKEDQEASLHTSQIQAFIRRSKAPGLISYIANNTLSPNFTFHPSDAPGNRHAPTPLHLAASTNVSVIVSSLLLKGKADPTITNQDGKTPFELAGDRSTRDAFRIARSELGESAWDWSKAHCPPPITKAEAEERDRLEKTEEQKTENARRKAELERLAKESSSGVDAGQTTAGRTLNRPTMTAEDRREVEGRGLTPETRVQLERERRARAAEERMKKMSGKS